MKQTAMRSACPGRDDHVRMTAAGDVRPIRNHTGAVVFVCGLPDFKPAAVFVCPAKDHFAITKYLNARHAFLFVLVAQEEILLYLCAFLHMRGSRLRQGLGLETAQTRECSWPEH